MNVIISPPIISSYLITSIINTMLSITHQCLDNIIMQKQQTRETNPTTITIDKEKGKIVLGNVKQELTYILVSSEPGRKIVHPPVLVQLMEGKGLEFEYKKCDGISEDNQSYCAIGFSNFVKKIDDIVERKPVTSIGQRVLYISKINAHFKPHSNNYFEDSSQRYNFSLTTMPPEDITASQIQQFLQKSMLMYGPSSKVDVKRNCLILSFEQDVNIKQIFTVKGIKQSENKWIVLSYWATTSHRTLYTYQPIKLIQLPAKPKIRQFVIHSEWLIISTENSVLFLHLYRPTQNFLSLNDVKIHAICPIDEDSVILFQYKFHYVYKLFTFKNPQLLGKAKTKKIQPYTAAFRKKTALFGGINYSAMMNQQTQQKEIYVVQNFTTCNMVNKNFLPDKKLQICKKSSQIPIKNLRYLSKQDLFICTCGQSVYLFHLDSSSLIASVDLTSNVQKLYQIDYPINIVNFMVSAKGENKLIRISFEQYGQIVGTEVTCIQKFGGAVDFCAEGKDICCTDGELVLLYGSNDKSRVLYGRQMENQRIKKVSKLGDFVTFGILKENILEAYFMQL